MCVYICVYLLRLCSLCERGCMSRATTPRNRWLGRQVGTYPPLRTFSVCVCLLLLFTHLLLPSCALCLREACASLACELVSENACLLRVYRSCACGVCVFASTLGVHVVVSVLPFALLCFLFCLDPLHCVQMRLEVPNPNPHHVSKRFRYPGRSLRGQRLSPMWRWDRHISGVAGAGPPARTSPYPRTGTSSGLRIHSVPVRQ